MRKHRIIVAIALVVLITSSFMHPVSIQSANLTTVKDTLQSSRLSFAGRVKAPTSAGSSHVWIYTTGTTGFYSISTADLKVGDAITIGTGDYTVASIIDADEFTTTTVLAPGDADDTDAIYFTSQPQHVVTFTTTNAIADGFFRVLLPAVASPYQNDGIPDSAGFDFNSTVDLAASPSAGYTFGSLAATPSGGTGCTAPTNYHCFEYHYSGTGAVGTPIQLTIGNTTGVNTPIAPAPSSAHTEGTADSYLIYVQNFAANADPATASPVDQTTAQIGVIESVRVTATVEPSITFSIAGVASGQTPCGTDATDVDTTTGVNAPLAVPFGTLSLNTFKNAAHTLTISTNATNGYTVTAIENDQLGKDGGTTPFIPDTTGDTGTATDTTSDTWNTATGHAGFGYTLKSISGTTVPFNTTGATFNVRQFPATADTESPATIMSNTTVANSDQANVCYRISVDATQAAGNYENQITYTATASF